LKDLIPFSKEKCLAKAALFNMPEVVTSFDKRWQCELLKLI